LAAASCSGEKFEPDGVRPLPGHGHQIGAGAAAQLQHALAGDVAQQADLGLGADVGPVDHGVDGV